MATTNVQYKINEYNINVCIIKEDIIKINLKDTTNNNEYYIDFDRHDGLASTNCENNITLFLKNDIYDFIINCFERKQYYDINIERITYIKDEPADLQLVFSFKYEQFDFEYTLSLFSVHNEE
jgi:hypothetical protein